MNATGDRPATVNVHIYFGPIRFASRIVKITGTLIDRGIFDRVVVVTTDADGPAGRDSVGPGREVWRVAKWDGTPAKSGFRKAMGLLFWSISVIRVLAHEKVDCINCHGLSVLPLSVLLKVVKGSILVYDTHELETETIGAGPVRRLLGKLVERAMMPFVDQISVVSQSIGQWYQSSYGRDVWVVKNVPYRSECTPPRIYKLRRALGIQEDELLFLFQGGMSRGRGIQLLIEAFSRIPDRHLVFLGLGDLVPAVEEYCRTFRNIHFHPAVPREELSEFTPDADVGLCLIENECRNHCFALPNKVFEYLVCGVPILVTDLPELSRVVSDFGCGWRTAPDVRSIRDVTLGISRKDIADKRENISRNRLRFGWQLEEEVLMNMYSRIRPVDLRPGAAAHSLARVDSREQA